VIPYFFVWALLALAALGGSRRWNQITSIGLWLVLTLLVGLRDQVGGDWFNYLPYLDLQVGQPFAFVFQSEEVGYAIANWLAANLDWGIYGTNTISGALFSVGLVAFCRRQPRPWLALTLAFPYLISVVAMGYTRQGVAIGFEMLALLALERGRVALYIAWLALAATFHKTALVMLVVPAITLSGSFRFINLLRLGFLLGAGWGLFTSLLSDSLESLQSGYLDAGYQSQGALIRIVLCLLPALVFLLQRQRFPITTQQRSIWTVMALLAVAAAVALVLSPSSTAVDRISLYLIPLQLFVGARLPDIRPLGLMAAAWNQLLVLFSLAVLSVWLLFAQTAFAWLPYRNLLLPF
jgi:hypothetical protein